MCIHYIYICCYGARISKGPHHCQGHQLLQLHLQIQKDENSTMMLRLFPEDLMEYKWNDNRTIVE